MALCPCNGCGGYKTWKEANQADFEAWLAQPEPRPTMAEWNAMKGDRAYGEMTIAEAEHMAVASGAVEAS